MVIMDSGFANALKANRQQGQCVQAVRRSRLELYADIIRVLAKRALTLDEIAFEVNTNCVTLEQKLDFLIKHDIVSIEISRDNKAFYVLTRRGVAIFRTFSITERLEKLRNKPHTPKTEAQQIITELEQQDEEAQGVWRNQNR
jgi:predicted transcriptional regulator